MRKLALLIAIIVILGIGVSGYSPTSAQSPTGKPPTPCKGASAAVYLVIDQTRRHIVDWTTFLNLGYKASDIVPCGNANNDPEGAAITRLIKGSGPAVYWMENGQRRQVPDMTTFTIMGFNASDISTLPDAIVESWPLGNPLNALSLQQQMTLGRYTIQLIKDGYTSYVLISAPNQPTLKVPYILEIRNLPTADITGEGDPDLLLIRDHDAIHVGIGTIIYDLGARPRKVLDIDQVYHTDIITGQGVVEDLNGDDVYEFVTMDVINTHALPPCILANVPAVLQYSRALKRYVSANRQFQSIYSSLIVSDAGKATTPCDAMLTLIYLNRLSEAKTLFTQIYPNGDSALWANIVRNVKRTRYYAPGS